MRVQQRWHGTARRRASATATRHAGVTDALWLHTVSQQVVHSTMYLASSYLLWYQPKGRYVTKQGKLSWDLAKSNGSFIPHKVNNLPVATWRTTINA